MWCAANKSSKYVFLAHKNALIRYTVHYYIFLLYSYIKALSQMIFDIVQQEVYV